ncbi:MAG TPA: hypothetical protein VJ949_04000 [Cryomorphaceae bacterium]|nr:hypothetical protein [Cryomorphaceae bacterium]
MYRNTVFAICMAFSLVGFSQEGNYRLFDYYEGYIVKGDGTKERGFIQYLDESDRYEKVVFKKTMDSKKEKFKVKDLSGYKVADTEYKSLEYEDVLFKGRNFLIVGKQGCINTYTMRKYDSEDRTWSGIVVLETEDRAVNYQKFALGFAKSFSEFLKDDAELSQKVRNGEKGYGILRMDQIIAEYNERCKS